MEIRCGKETLFVSLEASGACQALTTTSAAATALIIDHRVRIIAIARLAIICHLAIEIDSLIWREGIGNRNRLPDLAGRNRQPPPPATP
jgi:hypothetical protein